jgi:ribosomal protein S18 acetylase RimI-like enzyme
VSSETVQVRGFQPADLDALYQVCLVTANGGEDATHLYSDPRLPGDLYAAPYAIYEPSLAFVAEDAVGVGGYVVAALDSLAFAQLLEREWWPGLRDRHPQPAADGLSAAERQTTMRLHGPWGTRPDVAERFPAHLHINLVSRLQRRGLGRQLMTALVTSLKDQDSPGVHLHVERNNLRAIEFYRSVGFVEEPADYGRLFTMDLR